MAGPVVAAAVIFPPVHDRKNLTPRMECQIRDSKTLTPAMRRKLYAYIRKRAWSIAVACSSAREVDSVNVYQASLLAMRRAVQRLRHPPECVLSDARLIPGMAIPQLAIIKGDGLSRSIAAASIVAKVLRDRLMNRYSIRWPEYGFERHKGYGTAHHMEALSRFGPVLAHRVSYLPIRKLRKRRSAKKHRASITYHN